MKRDKGSSTVDLEREFKSPPDEFSPIPFWFWNDAIRETELVRQIGDFHSKGIAGFVIHPRMGIPKDIPYLSDRFMSLVRLAVETAAGFDMRVVLYDEAMYPSGSAHGEVVRRNPDFAARSLRLVNLSTGTAAGAPSRDPVPFAGPKLLPGEAIVAVFFARQNPDNTIGTEGIVEIPRSSHGFAWETALSAVSGSIYNRLLFFIETKSNGTIRGIHFGEDDGEPSAPAAADLLNPEAVAEFIRITHERYFQVLSPWFGSVIAAMFTDEPCILGRCCKAGEQPWTPGFRAWYEARGGRAEDFISLWFDVGPETETRRRRFRNAVNERLGESYYRQLSDWCGAHGIALTGHPAESADIGLESHFHIPGQDIVWRWVDPDNGTALSGSHSTMARCSSDAARLWGRRRNANECFGCCGPEGNQWAFSAADMKWYLDWLFVRGVNMVFPHAFFYSVEGEKRYGERPPDVGPNNIWWDEYPTIANYIRRMCWLNTDSVEQVDIAVLAEDDWLPWRSVRELYRHQTGFHYIPIDVFASGLCVPADGKTSMREQGYHVIVSEKNLDRDSAESSLVEKLGAHMACGGKVVMLAPFGEARSLPGVDYVDTPDEAALLARSFSRYAVSTIPHEPELRVSHVKKGDSHFLMLVNEGSAELRTNLLPPIQGSIERWDPWTGEIGQGEAASIDGSIPLRLGYRESAVFRIDTRRAPEIRLLDAWSCSQPRSPWEAFEYRTSVDRIQVESSDRWLLDCGEVGEIAEVRVNGRDAGSRLWKPYRFAIGDFLEPGGNTIVVQVKRSLAGKYGRPSSPDGLVGPVRLIRVPGP
jgi:hypothetical protein